jgi:hypothetical protein
MKRLLEWLRFKLTGKRDEGAMVVLEHDSRKNTFRILSAKTGPYSEADWQQALGRTKRLEGK